VTPQTTKEGVLVRKIWIEPAIDIQRALRGRDTGPDG
jgi:hypothetical protein